MPVRTIILRISEEEFKAYESRKRAKDSWERMFRREVLSKEGDKDE